ncbi:MAG: HypC/HybG/HupF family hydrogenase formation chaperone [Calditrichaeota bacterium]|nr:MAG: HypC/HybG/HupF family hydrogenase formation chaperone [Calditrichota bacterium]
MCLAIPGKLIELYEENGLKMGKLDYAGTVNTACLAYVPEIKVGQYAVVHAGFAISVIDEEEAQKTYELWDEMVEGAAKEGLDIFGMPFDEKAEDKKRDVKE